MNTTHQTNRVHDPGTSRYLFKSVGLSIALLGAGVATAEADTAKLVGTWKGRIQLIDCVSEQPMGEPFTTLGTYSADGNATEVPFSDPAARTASYGTWAKAGKRTFAAYSQFPVFDVNGFYAGYQSLERMLTVAKDRQTFEVRARTDRYDSSNVLLFSGCAAGAGDRLPPPTPF